jgi:primosomal protein N'
MSHLLAYIIPLSASQDSEGYTYQVPDTLQGAVGIGDLVEIPFRSDIQEGIIADLREVNDIPLEELEPLRSIHSILLPSLLSHAQVQVIMEQARTHCVHIHKVAALFLPAAYRKRIFKHELSRIDIAHLKEYSDDELGYKNMRLIYIENEEKLIRYARQFLTEPGSVVIAPNQRYIDAIISGITAEWVYVFPADSTDVQKAKAFVEARIWTAQCMIGGRRLAFCNLWRFRRILYLEDGLFKEVYHSFHKYRIFDMLLVTSKFAPHQDFFVASVTPSIEVASLAIGKKIGFDSFIKQ